MPPGTDISFQTLGRFRDQAEIEMRLDVKARVDEAELVGHVDISLQRAEIRHEVGVAVVIVLGEYPAEAVGRLFGELGSDFGRGIVVLGIEIPMQDS